MSFGKLIAQFENTEDLQVDLAAVAEWIKATGIRHEIEFIGVDLDVSVIRGFLHRYRYHEGGWSEPKYAADIHYGRNQTPEWVNIVVAKELIHIMDGDVCTKKDEFDNLVRRLTLPKELKVLLEDPAYAFADKFGDAFAAALLLPMAARNLMLPAYKAQALTDSDIAKLAVMPIKYVRMVMADEWESAYEAMRRL